MTACDHRWISANGTLYWCSRCGETHPGQPEVSEPRDANLSRFCAHRWTAETSREHGRRVYCDRCGKEKP